MKIGVIGTHGVGKTDVCKFLAYYLHKKENAESIVEVVRPLAQMGFPMNEETTFDAQEAIQNYQKVQESLIEHKIKEGELKYGVFDRTVIDNYVYAENKFYDQSRKILFPQMIDWINRHPYDLIFRVPLWNSQIISDGFRSIDKDFQMKINRKLNLLLEELKIPYQKIPKEFFLQSDEDQVVSFVRYFTNNIKNK